VGVVKKSHPRGFIIKLLFHIEQMRAFLTSSLKITSGEISADEQQGRAEAKEHHRQEAIKAVSTSKQPQSLQK
jgi:hypothetical protein